MKFPKVPPWIAHRTYKHGEECRVAISNEKDRELLVLEDEAAILWDAIANSGLTNLEILTKKLGYPLGEAVGFVQELTEIGLFGSELVEEAANHPQEQVDTHDVPAARNGGVLGTDDLETEFEFQDWAKERGYLWSTAWELTYRCNEKCLHCYNPGAAHDHSEKSRRGTQELKDGEWQTLLEELKDLGVFRLALTGGEVLERTDFFDILKYAKCLGFSVTVLTNGLAIDAPTAKKLAEQWPHRVEMSVYSHDAERHDAVTGVSGSFVATIKAAELLIGMGQSVTLKMVIMDVTFDDVASFKTLADNLGCEGLVDATISVGNDGSHDTYKNLRVNAYRLIKSALDPKHPTFCGTKDEPNNRFKNIDLNAKPCGAGHATLAVSPEGNVYPCIAFPKFLGSVREGGIKSIWNDSQKTNLKTVLSDWQNVTFGSFDRCGKYERCSWCSKCAGASFLETGDETSPNTVKCRNAASRMIAHQYLASGGTPETYDLEAFSGLKEANPQEYWLWSDDVSIVARIDLEAVKRTIGSKSRQRVLQDHQNGDE